MSTFTRSTEWVESLALVWVVLCALFSILISSPAAGAVRSSHVYQVPDVALVDSEGREVRVTDLLGSDGPVLVQFVFTTCPGICPVLAATFRSVRDHLEREGDERLERPAETGGESGDDVRMVSISIDPEHDTPERLADYAKTFGAGSEWTFLTGGHDEIVAVQKAFEAYRDNKMRHEPLTFLRRGRGAPWTRFEGFASAEEIVRELRRPAAP